MKGHLCIEDDNQRNELSQSHIEFAKIHVKKALEAQQSFFNRYTQLDEGYENAYPLENIK